MGEYTFQNVIKTDILTSMAKPLGDFARLGCHTYYFQDWSSPSSTEICSDPNNSYILGTLIIPFLAAWPLWMRMIQNLKQSYLQRKRWPFFPNALKYAF